MLGMTVVILNEEGKEIARIGNISRRSRIYAHLREIVMNASLSRFKRDNAGCMAMNLDRNKL